MSAIVVTELQKEKRKLESKGNLKEVAAVCNKIGELLSRLGVLLIFISLLKLRFVAVFCWTICNFSYQSEQKCASLPFLA